MDNTENKQKRGSYIKIDDKMHWGVYWLNKEGYSNTVIGKKVGLPRETVRTIVKRIEETNTPLPRQSTGRPKKINPRGLRHLERAVIRDPFMSIQQARDELKRNNINVCRDTVVSYLRDLGFKSYYAVHKPALTDTHKRNRLEWAKEHVDWTPDQWANVIWSDESRFSVIGADGGVRVLRRVGERYKEELTVPTTKFGKGGVMVWGCFWKGGVGPLVAVDGTMNQAKYIEVLSENFQPWLMELQSQHDRRFIFQEDGATCHTGALACNWKNHHMMKGFDFWPAQSPDLNPIEHLWWALEKRIESVRCGINNTKELRDELLNQWNQIGNDLIDRLIASMPDRCKAVIDANGGPTRY